MSEEGGIWRTIGGRRVFIKDGEDLATAMKNSGKFNEKGNSEEDKYEKYYKKEKIGMPKNFQAGEKVKIKSDYENKYISDYKIIREATQEEKQGIVNTNLKCYIVEHEIYKWTQLVPDIKIEKNK